MAVERPGSVVVCSPGVPVNAAATAEGATPSTGASANNVRWTSWMLPDSRLISVSLAVETTSLIGRCNTPPGSVNRTDMVSFQAGST
jgi:hypothetical protein